MLFNSFTYILFFPLVVLLYYIIPNKNRWLYLLLVSYGFYMNWNPVYALLLLFVTIVSYFAGLFMKNKSSSNSKKILIISIIISLIPLIIFKYLNFINDSVFTILNELGIKINVPEFKWLLPIGISFFTFKAISYMVDVYQGKISAEKNPLMCALYLSFFVDMAAGPIDRAEKLIPQFRERHKFCPDNVSKGLKLILWGYFMKLVIADRIKLYVDPIFNNLDNHSGISVLLAAILFSIQIYCDFGGYSYIAIGCGKIMGFDLMTNFKRPYMAGNVTDFWRRWHISLSTWFRDYVYIPLGGNRCSKIRNRLNLLITFTVSGLWHGANWTYVIWGVVNGIFQVIEKMYYTPKRKVAKTTIWNIILTFILMTIAWTFFRANTINDAIKALSMMCVPSGELYMPQTSLIIYIFIGCFILIISEILQEIKGKHPLFENKYTIVRFMSYALITVMILAFGVFDGGQFIYFQF